MIVNFRPRKKVFKLKNIKYKLIPACFVLAITTSLGSCALNKNKEIYTFSSIVNCLNIDDKVTNIDNYLLNSNFDNNTMKEIDNLFIDAYYNKDLKLCNKTIYALSTLLLKSLVAEGYNLDYEKIDDFYITGHFIAKEYAEGTERHSEYGVEFFYNSEYYKIISLNAKARELCIVGRAALKNELSFKVVDRENPEFVIKNAYEIIKEGLKLKLEYDNTTYQKQYSKKLIGEKYDGSFSLEKDKKKVASINKFLQYEYKIDLQNPYNIETNEFKENNLPVKELKK